MNICWVGFSDTKFAGSAYAGSPTLARAWSRYHTPASMHCFPAGARLHDDGKILSGVFLGGSLPPQPAEALATQTSASAAAIPNGRIPRGTRSNV